MARIIAIKSIYHNMEDRTKKYLQSVVKNNYQEIAAYFDVTRKKHTWPELEKILSFLKDGDSVLDVGCGNGRLLDNIKNKKIDYLGIDNSSNLIEIARKNYPENDFALGDILYLDKVTNKKFDLVISVAVLHHLPSLDLRLLALKQLALMTRSGGRIIFSAWKIWSNKKYLKPLIKNIFLKLTFQSDLDFGDLLFPWKDNQGNPLSERYYHAFTSYSLRSLLKKAGFKKFNLYSDNNNYWVTIDTP